MHELHTHTVDSEDLGSYSGLPIYKYETARQLLRSLRLSSLKMEILKHLYHEGCHGNIYQMLGLERRLGG